jgi:hypothetical protein
LAALVAGSFFIGSTVTVNATAQGANPGKPPVVQLSEERGRASFSSDGKQVRSGVLLVKPRAGVAEERLQQLFAGQGGREEGRIQAIGVRELRVPPQAMEAIQKAFSRRPEIAFAELDVAMPPVSVPNDRYYNNAWHLQTIDAPTAWTMSRGEGVVVAVLDTGIDVNQPDLQGKLVNGSNSTLDSSAINDVNGHGTRVAGSVAAATNNSIGVAAVGWDTKIMPIRVTNNPDGWAYWSDMARGLTWAADNGAHVANMSYQAWRSSTVSSAAKYLRDRGGLPFAAAGNDGSNDGSPSNPDIVVIAATNSSDVTTSWSNFGAYVDLAAPGEGIYTTNTGTGYWSGSGTSFASPVAAGVAALVMAANPQLTPAQVEQVLLETAKDLGSTGWDGQYGWGRIDAGSAVSAAWSQDEDRTPPDVLISSPTDATTVGGDVVVAVQASDESSVTEVSLYVNGKLHATETMEPFEFFWDTTQVAEGSATLYAEALDAAGNTGTHSVNVTVQQEVIEPEPTEPAPEPEPEPAPEPEPEPAPTLTLTSTSINEGRVWTAIVTLNGPEGAATAGSWDFGKNNVGGCTISSGTSCSFSLSDIRKNIGAVTYTDQVNNLSVTVGKP